MDSQRPIDQTTTDDSDEGQRKVRVVTLRQIDKVASATIADEFSATWEAGNRDTGAIEAAARRAVAEEFTADEIRSLAQASIDARIHKLCKGAIKRRSLGSVLADIKRKGGDLFDDATSEIVYEEEGVNVKKDDWSAQVAFAQERRIVDNKTEQDRAYVRDMDFMKPIINVLRKNVTARLGDVWDAVKEEAERLSKKR